MNKRFGGKAQFVLVYLREAHPKDGWKVPGWSPLDDPSSLKERKDAANFCCKELNFDFPTVVDAMGDATAVRWSGWPERLFVISKEGKVVFSGDQGPFAFNPGAGYKGFRKKKQQMGISLEQFLKAYLGESSRKWY